MKKPVKFAILGFIAGILNGIFGAGGGLLVVPMLESQKIEARQAHATSIAIIFPLSVISGALYLLNGVSLDWEKLFLILPLGLLGAAIGSYLLLKMQNKLLKKLFALVMILSSIRILFR